MSIELNRASSEELNSPANYTSPTNRNNNTVTRKSNSFFKFTPSTTSLPSLPTLSTGSTNSLTPKRSWTQASKNAGVFVISFLGNFFSEETWQKTVKVSYSIVFGNTVSQLFPDALSQNIVKYGAIGISSIAVTCTCFTSCKKALKDASDFRENEYDIRDKMAKTCKKCKACCKKTFLCQKENQGLNLEPNAPGCLKRCKICVLGLNNKIEAQYNSPKTAMI